MSALQSNSIPINTCTGMMCLALIKCRITTIYLHSVKSWIQVIDFAAWLSLFNCEPVIVNATLV